MDQAPADTFESLSEAIVALCGRIHGAEYRLIELIRRLEALKPWNRERPDCAHWLNFTCGMDLVTAREKVRIAHALDDLPQITDAFREGELSYSKVRAITRIATWDTEDELIELAQATTAEHVAKLVRARRQADQLSAPGAALNAWTHRDLDYRSGRTLAGLLRPGSRRSGSRETAGAHRDRDAGLRPTSAPTGASRDSGTAQWERTSAKRAWRFA